MESNNLSEREKDYLTNILKAEIELNDHYYPYDSELNDMVQSIMNKLNLKHKNNEN